MRVISGSARGRPLKAPGAATRPITDRVKTSLFNILSARIEDRRVLDLYAGAGSVGIEALSRGACAATFVELDRQALATIRANLEATRLGAHATVVRLDVFKFVRQPGNPKFDLIYVAPPQYKELWAETLRVIDGRDLLTDDGVIVAQIHPKEYKELALKQFELYDQRKYGSTMLCFYRKKQALPSA
jgi:16S rRNA (guanine(966)-N(2))-methyltransferase RsmD